MMTVVNILRRHWWLMVVLVIVCGSSVQAQRIDYDRLLETARHHVVIVNLRFELSFGMQSAEHEQRSLGLIADESGLLMFNGGFLQEGDPLSPMSSYSYKATPTQIRVMTLDKSQYEAEYIGIDRETGIAFARISSAPISSSRSR